MKGQLAARNLNCWVRQALKILRLLWSRAVPFQWQFVCARHDSELVWTAWCLLLMGLSVVCNLLHGELMHISSCQIGMMPGSDFLEGC